MTARTPRTPKLNKKIKTYRKIIKKSSCIKEKFLKCINLYVVWAI